MNGVLNVLKPSGMTSFDVISSLRKLLKIKKIGHAGTLDPMAAGVLPLCLGRATKAIEFMIEKDKLYRAELTLGISTDTQDSTGNVISSSAVTATDTEIIDVINSFTGSYMQLPPMYSAIKVNGKKLYELAREGKEVERKAREVKIYSVDIIDIDRSGKETKLLFDVSCSKGTYIRTLCSDIGDKLGCGGHMSFLLRKKAGPFELSSACTLEEITQAFQADQLDSLIINTEEIFSGLQEINLNPEQERKLLNGVKQLIPGKYSPGEAKITGSDGRFIAVGIIEGRDDNKWEIKRRKIFGEP